VAHGRVDPTQLGGSLDGRVGRGPSRTRVTLAGQHDALAREAIHLKDPIVSGLGLGHQLAELCGGTGQITLIYVRKSEAPAALARGEPVTDRLGEVASLFGGRARRDRVTGVVRCGRLPGEDLAEPPPVVQRPGQADRLGEVRPGQLDAEDGDDKAAGGQRPGQQGRLIDLARDRQGLLSLT
jgi:hypothetical protein